MDAFAALAALHHLLAFAIIAIVAAEMALLPAASTVGDYRRLGRIDMAYGIAAGLLFAIGLMRVFRGEAGSAFYLENPVFWAKLAAFAAVGALSVPPTLAYLGWNRRLAADATALPGAAEKARAMGWLRLQAAGLAAIPVLAALMARGVGL